MYQHFYGLRELPFELVSDPRYLYLSPGHREALSTLEYGLSAGKAVTVLIGEAGTGKTTLLNAALESDRCSQVRSICLTNPALTRTEFVETLARRLALGAEAERSKARLIEELERSLRETRARGEITALIVDEAQALTTDLLEEIRLLANLEMGSCKLLPLLLIGQPSLGARLETAAFRQLKQRVALRCETRPLTVNETALYIKSRVEKAGGSPVRLFTRDAVRLIHEYSGGVPRTISAISDNALLHGLAMGQQPVDGGLVFDACTDLALRPTQPSVRPLRLPDASPSQPFRADELTVKERRRVSLFDWKRWMANGRIRT